MARWRVELVTRDGRECGGEIAAETREQFKSALNDLGRALGVNYGNVQEVRFVRL